MVFQQHFNKMDRKRRFVLPDEEESDEKKKFVENVVRGVLRNEKVLANIQQLLIDVQHLKDVYIKKKNE